MAIKIVELGADDWWVLRDLKLKSLEQELIAFEDAEEGKQKYLSRSEAEWRENFDRKVTVFAQDESTGEYIGMVSAVPQGDNRAEIQHLYIDSRFRGVGAGKKMLQTLLDKLKTKGVQTVELAVLVTQQPAIELYHRLGFKDIGRISQGAKRGDVNYDEIEMELAL
jgi:ribosomal protein S18 acetylase RimI-like enzyme